MNRRPGPDRKRNFGPLNRSLKMKLYRVSNGATVNGRPIHVIVVATTHALAIILAAEKFQEKPNAHWEVETLCTDLTKHFVSEIDYG